MSGPGTTELAFRYCMNWSMPLRNDSAHWAVRFDVQFPPPVIDGEPFTLAVKGRVKACNEAITVENRQGVMAVLPVLGLFISLPGVIELEKPGEQLAIPEQVIQRRQEGSLRLWNIQSPGFFQLG